MGSKKYKNELCIYCRERIAECPDHVFARGFFLPQRRNHLPTVPCCKICNETKSKLEHYLTALLPFGGRHEDSYEQLLGHVPKRLNKNSRLANELRSKQFEVYVNETGIFEKTLAFPICPERLTTLFRYITRGLLWHHWRTLLPFEYSVNVHYLTLDGATLFNNAMSNIKAGKRTHVVSVGVGTVLYEGVQASDCPLTTAWRIEFYGGLMLIDKKRQGPAVAQQIGIITKQ